MRQIWRKLKSKALCRVKIRGFKDLEVAWFNSSCSVNPEKTNPDRIGLNVQDRPTIFPRL